LNINTNKILEKYNETILIIVSHTDDETLAMGGTIAKHINSGDKVYAISMTDGLSARNNATNSEIRERFNASEKAAEILGFKWIKKGNFPDNQIDSIPLINIIKFIEEVKSQINPSIIYTHSSADLNIDHQLVSKAVLTSFRPQLNETWKEIRLFEIPSSTDYGHRAVTNIFTPNLYINIEETWELKLKALKSYDAEMKVYPNSRSYIGLENLSKYRGNQVGLKFAESFEILRKIIR